MFRVLSLAVLLMAGCSRSGEVSGRVQDPAGAVVPTATVTLKFADGRELRSKTDTTGTYKFEMVPYGKHTLTATASGFEDVTQPLDLQATSRRDITLKLKNNCTFASAEELAALGDETFILLEEWSDFGTGQRRLRLSTDVAEYSSEYFERKGALHKKAPMTAGGFAALLKSLELSRFWDLEGCQGGRGIDSGMKALTVSAGGKKKQVVIENDAPSQVQAMVHSIAKESKLWPMANK